MKAKLLVSIGSSLVIVGCATAPQPVFEETAPVASEPTHEVFYPGEPEHVPEPPRVVVQEPRQVESNQNPALDALIDQALQYLSEREYARAVSTAERAMSIDRYDPRVYLMLAQAHRYSGNLALSRQYAERGLAFTQPGSTIYHSLEDLR